MRYYIGKDGNRLGPFDAQQVRAQLDAGAISYEDLVWREGMSAWAPVRTEFPPLSAPPLPPPGVTTATPFGAPPAIPSASGGGDARSTDAGPVLAERTRRLVAASIDHLVFLLCLIPGLVRFAPAFLELVEKTIETNQPPDQAVLEQMLADAFGPWSLLLLFVGVVQIVLLSLRGQTLGKLVCRIRIVRLNGARAGFLHAFLLRSAVIGFISGVPVVGWMIAVIDPLLIFREDRRCLHDLIAGTAVVDV